MAKEKKSFVLYSDLIHSVKSLSDKEAGILLKTILSYVNDEGPVVTDKIIKLVFEPVKLQLKRDLIKYESKKDQCASEGKYRLYFRAPVVEDDAQRLYAENIIGAVTSNQSKTHEEIINEILKHYKITRL